MNDEKSRSGGRTIEAGARDERESAEENGRPLTLLAAEPNICLDFRHGVGLVGNMSSR